MNRNFRTDFSVAKALAADLAGSGVDPNEVAKSLSFLCSKRDSRAFLNYLQKIVTSGGIVIRSGRTLNYYRDLLAACERHLRGMDAEEMAQTLGWAIRLLRYYRAVPEAAQIRPAPTATAPRQARPAEAPRQPTPAAPERPPTTQAPAVQQVAPQPAAPPIPEIGDIFGGTVLAVDPQGVRVKVKNLGEDVAIGVIKAENLAGKQYQPKGIARVEVVGKRILSSGLTVLDLKPAPKVKK